MNKQRATLAGCVLTLICAGAGAALAADLSLPDEPVDSDWSFTFAPYVWMAGLSGETAQFGLPEVDLDASFGDVLSNLDLAAMAVSEVRYGRFGLATDFQYVKLSADADTPVGLLADNIDATTESLTAMAAGSFRVIESDDASFDLLAGARLWSVKTEFDLDGGLLDGASFDDKDTWVDPIVGVKGRAALSDEFYLTGWGTIGGFGVSSDLTWDVMGALGYSFNESVAVIGGYRAMGVDYENGDFVYDVVQHGPILGAVIKF